MIVTLSATRRTDGPWSPGGLAAATVQDKSIAVYDVLHIALNVAAPVWWAHAGAADLGHRQRRFRVR